MVSIPDGFFVNGLIFWGKSFSRDSIISKGFFVEVPDIRCFSTQEASGFYEKIRAFLAELDSSYRLQIQWSVGGNYDEDLCRYENKVADFTCTPIPEWARFIREERSHYFRERAGNGTLRKEVLALFLSHKCNTLPRKGLKKALEVESFLASESRSFVEKITRFSIMIGSGSLRPMEDFEHYEYFSKFFDPSISNTSEQAFDAEESILGNTLLSDGMTTGKDGEVFIKIGDYYNALFIIRKWPRFVYPGIMVQLMDAQTQDFCITQNIFPLSIGNEIKKEEQAIKHLGGNVRNSGKVSLESTIEKKYEKIRSLMDGYTMPYKVLTVVRVWSRTLNTLFAKNMAIKTAIQHMNGAKYHQVNQPVQAKSIFFETFPGWTGGSRRGWDLYAENHELAALVPVSNSFSGNLNEAEAFYEGINENLVGLSSFVGGTPQHAVLIGMTGAGKSVAVCDFLSQTAAFYDYTAIIEEGLSYGIFTKLMGCEPIIMSPDAAITINYLDTNELPLSISHLSVATKLCLKMVGMSQNEDVNNYRGAVICAYLNRLYDNRFEDWRNKNQEKYELCLQEAYLIEKKIKLKLGSAASFEEAFIELQSIKNSDRNQYQDLLRSISPDLLLAFEKDPKDGIKVRDMAFSYFEPEEYPTHSQLVELMQYERFSNHRQEEVDLMATLLSAWGRYGDKGRLFDGVTNFKLTGKVAHFELGYIPESAKELKEATGFLISNFIRGHIVKMPRGVRKRIVFEEVSRFLNIPGGDVILNEAYAQFRKYGCWVLCVTQQFSQLKVTPLYKVVMGNSKLFLLMKQNQREDIDEIADSIGLPDTAKEAIQNYTLPEHQNGKEEKCSFMTVFALDGKQNYCGTIKIKPSKELLYVASSDGKTFDIRAKALLKYNSIFDGVIQEVEKMENER
ncbi:hypothetical protein AYO37_00095 [Opitutia bacterium SCGC AG-212-L18]|nr:hypothetical protein AYO37_00095 [Opitutae bacterium SCGC AG-212-L18]